MKEKSGRKEDFNWLSIQLLDSAPRLHLMLLILHCVSLGFSLSFDFLCNHHCSFNVVQSWLFPPSVKPALVPIFIPSVKKGLSEEHSHTRTHTHFYWHLCSIMTKTSHFVYNYQRKPKKTKCLIKTPPSHRFSPLSYYFSRFLHSNGKLLAVVLDQCVEIR